jgi:hypothetical protein
MQRFNIIVGLMMNIDVGIQDLMLDIHGITWNILCSRAKERKYYIEQYGKQQNYDKHICIFIYFFYFIL